MNYFVIDTIIITTRIINGLGRKGGENLKTQEEAGNLWVRRETREPWGWHGHRLCGEHDP